MKLKTYFFKAILLLSISNLIISCDNDDANLIGNFPETPDPVEETSLTPKEGFEFIEVAIPELMSKSEFRQTTEVTEPQPVSEVGKIYAYKDYIFITENNKGIHVIDNSNPESPFISKFIKVLQNEDISIKNDFLYADSATDLVVFSISNINSISEVDRLEDIFDTYDFLEIDDSLIFNDIDLVEFDAEEEIIVGWTTVTEEREILPEIDITFEESESVDFATADIASDSGTVGQGGSLARFKIVEGYLYTVSSHEMFIFDITNLAQPNLVNTQYTGWGVETIFYADDYLYLGGTQGMYIYGINNPAAPEYVSEFIHWEGCDPVVVDGNYAYLTLRGGNLCGQDESVLEVIDINDKRNPTLAARHILENPYGLGIKNNTLFVCDGTAGLKLFNKTDPLNLELITTYSDINSKDVIPLENSLLMIGETALYQYSYIENGVELISTFQLK